MAKEFNGVISENSSHKEVHHKLSRCNLSYQIRKLKNKGAIIILVWNFFMISASEYLIAYVKIPGGASVGTVALGFTLPFAGWLADVRFGRYKVIHWSMWIMWIASMLATVSSVVSLLVNDDNKIFQNMSVAMFVIVAIGFGGYQANIIQFGLDQLQDASTTEITAFIRWYVWTVVSGRAVYQTAHTCVDYNNHIMGQLVTCISLTIVISSSFIFSSCLVKEPVTQNPFKLIYNVIRYAIKQKQPRCRSAFTYCEDELPSRIDFGKSKYGGPFTIEQVEDVKTFLRLLVMITLVSVLVSDNHLVYRPIEQLTRVLTHTQSTISECYKERFLTTTIGFCAAALAIPLYELTVYPTTQKCIPEIKLHQKFISVVIIQIVRVIIIIAFDLTARKTYAEHHNQTTPECIFRYDQGALSSSFNSHWIAFVQLLNIISLTVLSISGIDFLVSQTPYSMRGLIIGTGYGSIFVFMMIGYGIYWPLTEQPSTWATGIISCEFWYLLSVLLVMIIFSGLLHVAGRWYKNRKREDVLPNEHIFAERYYSQVN